MMSTKRQQNSRKNSRKTSRFEEMIADTYDSSEFFAEAATNPKLKEQGAFGTIVIVLAAILAFTLATLAFVSSLVFIAISGAIAIAPLYIMYKLTGG